MGLWSRFRKTIRGERRDESEIEEELQFHLDMDAEDRGGREARMRMGNMTRIAEETRAAGIVSWLESILQDVRYGLRQLRKTPAMVTAVVLSLTIGIGANTAIFSLVDAALLKPLPVEDPASLRIVEWTNDGFPEGVHNINGDCNTENPNRFQCSSIGANLYRRLAHEKAGFEALIAIADPSSVAIAVDASPAEQASIQYVSGNFFQALGVTPVVGRPFRNDEDRVGQEQIVIVSHRFWTSRLAGDNDALNRQVRINNIPARIAGVAPPGFFGLRAGQWTDIYAPLAMRAAFLPTGSDGRARGENDSDWWVRQVGRLKPGVPEAEAIAQINGSFRKIAPEGMKNVPELIVLPGRRGFNALNRSDSGALWILMLLVGVLLLIVCANVANLLLSRSIGRNRESAVRLALGAARARLFRQHLIESGVLALLGGAAGLVLGYLLAESIHVLFQTGRNANSAFDLHLDLRILGYTGALSILTTFLFGLAPALKAARADLNEPLKTQSRSVTGGRLRLPRLLVTIQIALCLVALVAAGLLGRSLQNLRWMDVGFDRENLAYVSVNPWQAGYSPERIGPYADRLGEELAAIPGVLRVSTTQIRPLSGNGNMSRANVPGHVVSDATSVHIHQVGEGFFEVMRIPLVAGRAIEPRDIRPAADAVVVDELFVKRFFPSENPLGRRFGFGMQDNNRFEIVGVVRDSRYNSLRNGPAPAVYQANVPGELRGGAIHFVVRAGMDSARLSEAVRKAAAAVDRGVPVTEFHTQTALIDRLLRTERLLGFVSGAFGLTALILAAIGLGSLLAYAVARRTNEIGVRMALGATTSDVIGMVLRDSFRMVVVGLLIGIPCAYFMATALKSILFGTEPLDRWTVLLSFAALLTVALLAAWLPARRAARIDPVIALREE